MNTGCRSSLRSEQVPRTDDAAAIADADPQATSRTASTDPDQSVGIDKSVLAVAAPRRYRNREHLRYVAKQPCLICGRKPSDPHHLRFLQPRALGRKASDEFAVPALPRPSSRGPSRRRRASVVAGGRHRSHPGRAQALERHPHRRGPDCARPKAAISCRRRSSCKTWRGSCGDSSAGLTTSTCSPRCVACGELFHTATGTAFADLLVDGHRETWPIRSKRFRGWLRRRYYEATGGRSGRAGDLLGTRSARGAGAI